LFGVSGNLGRIRVLGGDDDNEVREVGGVRGTKASLYALGARFPLIRRVNGSNLCLEEGEGRLRREMIEPRFLDGGVIMDFSSRSLSSRPVRSITSTESVWRSGGSFRCPRALVFPPSST
jgi:hypothetical protein